MRILVFIFAALIAAGGTGFYLFRELQAPSASTKVAEAPKTRDVFVPAAEIAAGSILQPDALARMVVPEKSLNPEMIVADKAGRDFLTGSVARQILPKGVPIARSATVQPGDRGFLAAVLPKGMRAISIPITETSGLNGLALPGDWVDLILTYSVTAKDSDGAPGEIKQRDIHASETVARNIRLLALDNRVNAPQPDEKGKVVAPVPRTATLQVTPREAEEITLASTLGSLALALNSVRDGGETNLAAESEMTAPEMTEPIALGTPARSRRPAPTEADMTIDSDVTSLLRLEAQRTVPEQVARIQVVRGSNRSSISTTKPVPAAAPAASLPPISEAPPSTTPTQ